MKKILLIAASAMMVFASCSKVDINYANDGQPQEIAMFAVNKNMTKAPVAGTAFKGGDNMRVSAYLAKTDDANKNNTGSYFTNVLFSKKGEYWTGGWYWPLSSATMNFVAVTEIGGGVTLGDSKTSSTGEGVFTVTLDNNAAATTSQTDLMYAVGRGTNQGNSTDVTPVDMKFKHALAWVNFAFKTNVENVITIKSVELTARYNGTLTVTPDKYTSPTETLSAEASWSEKNNNEVMGIKVPNVDNTEVMGDLNVPVDYDVNTDGDQFAPYGNGLLVVPGTSSDTDTFFTIVYTIKQKNNGDPVEYTYKHLLKNTTWAEGKKYTYNININLQEIEVNPSVIDWNSDSGNTSNVPLG